MSNEKYEVSFQPQGKKIKVRPGTTLLAAARTAGVSIPVRCEGKMGCLMCKVSLQPPGIGVLKPQEEERRKLGSSLGEGVRLACQAKVSGDVTVLVPEDRLKRAIRLQLERQQQEDEDGWLS